MTPEQLGRYPLSGSVFAVRPGLSGVPEPLLRRVEMRQCRRDLEDHILRRRGLALEHSPSQCLCERQGRRRGRLEILEICCVVLVSLRAVPRLEEADLP